MSTKKLGWFLISILLLLFMAGCRCDNSVIPTFYGIADAPADGEITSLNPSFDWHGSESCEPDEYLLKVVEEAATGGGPVLTNIAESALPYTYTGTNFLPGRSYIWYLTAINGATDTDPYVFGPETEVGQFFTGPVCSNITLVAPELLDPDVAEVLSKEYLFKWFYPGGCLPISYEVQFANDAGFTDIYLTTSTTEPYAQELLMAFPDCSSMFWRVRASDGTNFGPWSASNDFYYVISDACGAARVDVRLSLDRCDQTGEIAAWTQTLNVGCKVEGMIIVGAGEYVADMRDYEVDLGSGPCPSTGLYQKSDEFIQDSFNYRARFGVMTPGTYCVSISNNQETEIIFEERIVDLMDGIWTRPRTNQAIAERTVELPADGVLLNTGITLVNVAFLWDEVERTIFTYPLEYTYDCKIGPEKNCPTYDFAPAGEAITLLARDRSSDWKLTELNGELCYINLPDVVIQENLAGYGPESENLEDLGYFHPPGPCVDPGSATGQNDKCSVHIDRTSCSTAGCIWHPDGSRASGYCASE